MSQRAEPRTAKNSALRERRSKSGWASAKAESAARWTPARTKEQGGSGARSRTVENSRPGGQNLAARHFPALRERPFEALRPVVRVRVRPFGGQEPLHHRIVASGKLDHELRAQA